MSSRLPVSAPDNAAWRPFICTAQDGLRLFARDYNPEDAKGIPVVCLPGLTRNSSDFHDAALHMTRDAAYKRRVFSIDYRGRGQSGYDSDWKNYTVATEANDVMSMLTAAGIEEAIFFGTSRGGLITLMLGALRPAMIKGVIMNDIGPVIDGQGLARIRQYVGKMPKPKDYGEAASILRHYSDQRFPAFDDRAWMKMAAQTWKQVGDRLVPDYDIALQNGLKALDLEKPLPALWEPFMALAHLPFLSIRAEHSDLFSAQTQDEMARRHPNLTVHVVPGQGHAPALDDLPTLMVLSRFLATLDGQRG